MVAGVKKLSPEFWEKVQRKFGRIAGEDPLGKRLTAAERILNTLDKEVDALMSEPIDFSDCSLPE